MKNSTHKITVKESWCKYGSPNFLLNGEELLVFGNGVNSVHNYQDLLSSLYDTYQTNESIKENDEFSLEDGTVFATASGVHVIITPEGEILLNKEMEGFKDAIIKKEHLFTKEILNMLTDDNLLRLYGELEYTTNNVVHFDQLITEQKQGYREY